MRGTIEQKTEAAKAIYGWSKHPSRVMCADFEGAFFRYALKRGMGDWLLSRNRFITQESPSHPTSFAWSIEEVQGMHLSEMFHGFKAGWESAGKAIWPDTDSVNNSAKKPDGTTP